MALPFPPLFCMLDSPQFLFSLPCICCGTVLYFSRLDEGDWALAWKCFWGTGGCRWWEREIFFIFRQQVANTKKISTVYPWLHFQSTCAKNKNYGLHWWGFCLFVCGLRIPSPQTMNNVNPQLDPYTEEPFTNDMWETLFLLWPLLFQVRTTGSRPHLIAAPCSSAFWKQL